MLLFYSNEYKLSTTNLSDVKECKISEQNPPLATLLMGNTKQYRKHKLLLYNDKYIGSTTRIEQQTRVSNSNYYKQFMKQKILLIKLRITRYY